MCERPPGDSSLACTIPAGVPQRTNSIHLNNVRSLHWFVTPRTPDALVACEPTIRSTTIFISTVRNCPHHSSCDRWLRYLLTATDLWPKNSAHNVRSGPNKELPSIVGEGMARFGPASLQFLLAYRAASLAALDPIFQLQPGALIGSSSHNRPSPMPAACHNHIDSYRAERLVQQALSGFKCPEWDQRLYYHDSEIENPQVRR